MYELYYTNDAKRDYKKVSSSKIKEKVHTLLDIIRSDPFTHNPPYKKLRGNFIGLYSRRITLQHRLFYEVDMQNKRVKIIRMWSHYGD